MSLSLKRRSSEQRTLPTGFMSWNDDPLQLRPTCDRNPVLVRNLCSLSGNASDLKGAGSIPDRPDRDFQIVGTTGSGRRRRQGRPKRDQPNLAVAATAVAIGTGIQIVVRTAWYEQNPRIFRCSRSRCRGRRETGPGREGDCDQDICAWKGATVHLIRRFTRERPVGTGARGSAPGHPRPAV